MRRRRSVPPDFSAADREVWDRVRDYTMTSPERMLALRNAAQYIARAGIEGAVVECGVWRGGSMMTVALTLLELQSPTYDLYLFDTFTGMPAPGPEDVSLTGESAATLLERSDTESDVWAISSLANVRAAMASTGYPAERVHFVEGVVEDTIPDSAPERIALLRLDTDWYSSTKHELTHLFPRLERRGVLLIDDYGHWSGARQATDEYFEREGLDLLLARIDYTGRIAIKC
jgi:hypothetical protein